MSNTSRLFVCLEVESYGAEDTLKGINKLLEDTKQLAEVDVADVFDILIEGHSIEFYTTQREGYGSENADDIAKLLGAKFPNKITRFFAEEILTESVSYFDDQEEFNEFVGFDEEE